MNVTPTIQTTRSSDFLIPCYLFNNNTNMATPSDSAYSTPRNRHRLIFRTFSIQHRKTGQLHTSTASNNPGGGGGTKLIPHVLFSEPVRTNCNQFYMYHGYILYTVDTVSQVSSLSTHYYHRCVERCTAVV